jgi:hypothetical protein
VDNSWYDQYEQIPAEYLGRGMTAFPDPETVFLYRSAISWRRAVQITNTNLLDRIIGFTD